MPGFAALAGSVPMPTPAEIAQAQAAMAAASDPGATAAAAANALNAMAAQAGTNINAALAANATPAANASQIAGLGNVAIKAASGQPLTGTDVMTGVVGVCALVSPALGAAMATCVAFEMVFVAGLEAIFKALGWLAQGSKWNPGQDPPKDPSDPKWVHPDPAFWRLDGADILPASLQSFMVPILQQNWENVQNGRPGYLDQWLLIQQLATAWNAIHDGPAVSFGMLGAPTMPGYGAAPVSTVTIAPGGGFTAGTFKHQLDTLRVRGYLLNDVPQWSTGNDYNPPVPDTIKALVVNSGAYNGPRQAPPAGAPPPKS